MLLIIALNDAMRYNGNMDNSIRGFSLVAMAICVATILGFGNALANAGYAITCSGAPFVTYLP